MRVAVTGGLGFLGHHLVRRLVDEYEVVVLDNFSRGTRRDEVLKLGVEVRDVDVRDVYMLLDALDGADRVVHLAALIDVHESRERPLLYHEVNTSGTLNVLYAAAENQVDSIVFASSAAVYGEPIYLPVDEEHPLNPISVYGATKAAAEQYCRAFNRAYGLSVAILRIFNVYGPGQSGSYAGVITRFIERILRGQPLMIYGDGRQTRDFVYVDEVVEAIVRALRLEKGLHVVNVASGGETSILGLARLLEEIAGRAPGIVFRERRIGDIRRSYASIARMESVLGYRPRVSLEEGLRKTLEWFRRNMKPRSPD